MMVPALVCGVLVVLADQSSKWLIAQTQANWGSSSFFGSLVRIRPVANTRPALGFALRPFSLLSLWVVTSPLLVLLIQSSPFLHHPIGQAVVGVAWGGATSNLLDYLRRGAIVDFIDLGSWPVFNLADVAIVLGIAVALLSLQ